MFETHNGAEHTCPSCYLFESGPADPAWLARVRAELGLGPLVVVPSLRRCMTCGDVVTLGPRAQGRPTVYCPPCRRISIRAAKARSQARAKARRSA